MTRALPVLLALTVCAVAGVLVASAATGALTPVASATTVDPNQAFTVSIHQNIDVTTTSTQTDVTFDPGLLQVTDFQLGAAYQGAILLGGVAPQTKLQAIAEANTTGTLKNIAAFFAPGGGSVPSGDAEFLVVSFNAKSTSGTSAVSLINALIVDENGASSPVTGASTQVTVTGPTATPTAVPTNTPAPTTSAPTATPTPTPTAGGPTTPVTSNTETATPTPASTTPTATLVATATPVTSGSLTPTPTPTPTPTVTPVTSFTPTPTPTPTHSPTPTFRFASPTPTPSPAFSGGIAVKPASIDIRPGTEFTITLVQNVQGVSTGAQAAITFDPKLLQIVSLAKGSAYSKGSLIYGQIRGAIPLTGAAAIADANTTGTLERVGVFVVVPATIPAGESEMVTIKLRSVTDASGTTKIDLSGLEILDVEGREVPVSGAGGQVNVSANAPVVTALAVHGLPNTGGSVGEGAASTWVLLTGAGLLLLSAAAGFVAIKVWRP